MDEESTGRMGLRQELSANSHSLGRIKMCKKSYEHAATIPGSVIQNALYRESYLFKKKFKYENIPYPHFFSLHALDP
jgi:hypothetical protein